MKSFLALTFGLAALSTPAAAQPTLTEGLSAALKGCETWVLNPATWVDDVNAFARTAKLDGFLQKVNRVGEASLPPEPLRQANHYWRINVTPTAGYVLVVSDVMPMCHVTGGGDVDLQPTIESFLASEDFAARWQKMGETHQGEMLTTRYQNREDSKFTMVVSRAGNAGQRTDRVQFMATATYVF